MIRTASGRPAASLSLDLDNQWSYMKTHGDAGWQTYPSYLDLVVPRILRFLGERELQSTIFVVGKDAAIDANHAALRAVHAAGHEIGNHSFHHDQWFHLFDEEQTEKELTRAEDAIGQVTGVRPNGFRGPGFSLSETTLRVLERCGYRYDATTFPTFIGPLARAYYFMTANLTADEREQRKKLFGGWREARRPLKLYRWQLGRGVLFELPVTTMPLLRTPIHVSYLLYLSMVAPALAHAYFEVALRLCRWRGVAPSILLHPLDFLGRDDTRALDFFPAMRLPSPVKIERVGRFIDRFQRHFDLLGTGAFVELAAGSIETDLVAPRFNDDATLAARPAGVATAS